MAVAMIMEMVVTHDHHFSLGSDGTGGQSKAACIHTVNDGAKMEMQNTTYMAANRKTKDTSKHRLQPETVHNRQST